MKIDITLPLGLLTILFVVLKLTNLISWSWFWVLSPVLIPLIFSLVIVLFLMLLFICVFMINGFH